MTEQQTTPTSEILNRAADLIEERGWTRGMDGWPDTSDSTAPVCLEGGIMAARGLTFWSVGDYQSEFMSCPAYVAVSSHLADRMPTAQLCAWNDMPTRTAAEVIEVLRAAALIEAAKENEAAPVEVSS